MFRLYTWGTLGLISLGLFLFFMLVTPKRSDGGLVPRNYWGMIVCVFVFVFCLGVYRFHDADLSSSPVLDPRVGGQVVLSGVIVDEPDQRENNQKLTVETKLGKSKIKVVLSASLDEDYRYGDALDFSGQLSKPENFPTDQGKEFDYVNYLRKDGVLYTVNFPEIKVTARGQGNKVKATLFWVKNIFLEKINAVIPDPESLLLAGLILGERSNFSTEMREKFIDTGTIHIVALSGYNVTIVAEWIMRMLAFLPLNVAFAGGIVAIALFVIMAGGQATAVRAGSMAVLALVARATGRTYDVARALALAGVAMIFFNPFVLVYDVSFQLSFIATVAVIFFAPKVEGYFQWVTPRFKLRDVVSVTTAAYIFVLPFILYNMGNLSLVALPANILVLPFIPITMGLGFFTSFFGVFHHLLSVPFGYMAYLALHFELGVIDFFSRVPFAAFPVPDFPLVLTLIIYVYFVYRLFGRSIKSFFTVVP
jgi:competence protein ComEC